MQTKIGYLEIMAEKFSVAAIQMASGPNVNANLLEADRLIGGAVDAGAKLVVLPENFALMGISETDKVEQREQQGFGVMQEFLSTTANRYNVWLVGGTIPLEASAPGKIRAACLVYDDQGQCQARYDKMHLFDVELVEHNEQYTESETIEAGDTVQLVKTPFGCVGIAICYDLRFPEIFRYMLDKGMDLLVVPSAFTAITGKSHWEILVRARAIENLCYVIAAAQGGYHINGRETHGDSMIVDPWGQVLSHLEHGAGFVVAQVDPDCIKNIRRSFPAIEHRKLYCK